MVQLLVEAGIWWSLVIVVAASRFVSRRITLGAFRRYQADEYLMLAVLAFYTSLIVTINIVQHTSSNLLPPGFDVASLSPSDISERVYGSKIILVVEQCQCATVWGAKACLILMYLRLTTLRWENLAIKLLGAYIAITFVAMEILYFGVWCRPFTEYFAVPTDNIQCNAAINHLITNASFNLSSDCMMLAIGLPMFLRMRVKWQKKLPLILIFSLGIFVILAAVLNKVYSFTQPFGAMWSYWYVRESSTALLVANLPFVWNFWRFIFRIRSDSVSGVATTSSLDGSTLAQSSRPAAVSHGSTCDMERGDSVSPQMSSPMKESKDMSFEEWLSDDSFTPVDKSGPVNPYTHPALFYNTRPVRAAGPSIKTQVPMKKALLANSPTRDTMRRESDTDERGYGCSPVSSVFPSLSSRRSVNSFV